MTHTFLLSSDKNAMYFVILITLTLANLHAEIIGGINAGTLRKKALVDLCQHETDLTNQMPAIQDQGEFYFCYAFAATAVYHQYACKHKSPLCHAGPSVLDAVDQSGGISDQKNSLGTKKVSDYINDGGMSSVTLRRLNENGICPEKFAPYPSEYFKNYSGTTPFAIEQVINFYNKYHEKNDQEAKMCHDADRLTKMLLGNDHSSPDEVTRLIIHLKKVFEYENPLTFLRDTMVFNECKENRQKVPPYDEKKSSMVKFP